MELTLSQSISNYRNRIEDTGIRFEEFIFNHPDKDDSVLKRSVSTSIEDNLNPYEKGWSLYIDDKIATRGRTKKRP